jgi:hypothetical protein
MKWNPYPAQMPNRKGEYLITVRDGQSLTTFAEWGAAGWVTDSHSRLVRLIKKKGVDIVAWMELPEPYKKA